MKAPSIRERLKEGFSYAFGGLIGDVGGWLLVGIGVAGVISFFVPADFLGHHAGGDFTSLIAMLLIGIPLYVCATSSTPIAAALVFKGLSPGAALVFLLAGPATNASTITVIAKLMGKRIAALYVVAISICSIALGWAVNSLYHMLHLDAGHWVHHAVEAGGNPLGLASSLLLLFLILRNYLPRPDMRRAGCGCEASH